MYLLFKTLAVPRAPPASAFATLALVLCLIITFDSLLSFFTFDPHDSDHRYVRENRGENRKLLVEEEPTSSKEPVTVYVFGTGGKRAQSMFYGKHMDRFGSGEVEYILEERDDCKHSEKATLQDSPCLALNFWANRGCSYDDMIRHYSTCKTMLVADEWCADNRYDAKGYYTSTLADKPFLPLGPRYDSWEAFGALMNETKSIPASSQRKYAFNAIFSKSTSTSRAELEEAIQKEGGSLSSFIQIAPKWHADPNNPRNELADSTTYMKTLLESTFTLSPSGHNPQCYRLFEAVEAGSIPVIALDKDYREHACKDSLSHWLNAPIVIVESWNEVMPTLQKMLEDPEALDKRQADLRAWYDKYMRTTVTNFESFLLS